MSAMFIFVIYCLLFFNIFFLFFGMCLLFWMIFDVFWCFLIILSIVFFFERSCIWFFFFKSLVKFIVCVVCVLTDFDNIIQFFSFKLVNLPFMYIFDSKDTIFDVFWWNLLWIICIVYFLENFFSFFCNVRFFSLYCLYVKEFDFIFVLFCIYKYLSF